MRGRRWGMTGGGGAPPAPGGGGGEGKEGEKIPTGTRSRLWNAQRMLASKKPQQAPADSNVPFGKFSPSFPPGSLSAGTEDREGTAPSGIFRG